MHNTVSRGEQLSVREFPRRCDVLPIYKGTIGMHNTVSRGEQLSMVAEKVAFAICRSR